MLANYQWRQGVLEANLFCEQEYFIAGKGRESKYGKSHTFACATARLQLVVRQK